MSPAEPANRFLRACHLLAVDRTPVWFMRQAGRYMPEYQAIRAKYSLLDICAAPELAAEVALQPVNALGVDAAILFADILLPVIPMGLDLEFVKGEGPVIHNPVRSASDVRALKAFDPEDNLRHVLQAIAILRRELPSEVDLLGFAGGPFTVACYMVEGGGSRHFRRAKSLMYQSRAAWHELMEKLSAVMTAYLLAQIDAGAQAVQLFDTWIGALSPEDYRDYVLPHSATVLQAAARADVPVIHFGTGTASLLEAMREAGGDVIGIDWRIPLDQAWERLGPDIAIQGNLDPTALFAPQDELERRVTRILEQADGRPGHIFNLGHGILPQTPVDAVRQVVGIVHSREIHPIQGGAP